MSNGKGSENIGKHLNQNGEVDHEKTNRTKKNIFDLQQGSIIDVDV